MLQVEKSTNPQQWKHSQQLNLILTFMFAPVFDNQTSVREEMNELKIMKEANNYNSWLYSQLEAHKSKDSKILEIGAGIGTSVPFIFNDNKITLTDKDENSVKLLREQYYWSNKFKVLKLDIEKAKLSEKYDSILCINVLEHIENDFRALVNMGDMLKKDGELKLFVPAFRFAYGELDNTNKHYRRYSKSEVEYKLEMAGLKPISISYFNSLGLLGWFIYGRLLRRKQGSLKVTLFYDRFIVPVLAFIEKLIPIPFGQSIIAIAVKKWK
ncbi:MAG: class I SAM-dependent methyltransferase [candidate division Zixibacteria bacterium]|nr:class I SAM-dependent methyltransferase [candidate division Zixibacteria bacterium]